MSQQSNKFLLLIILVFYNISCKSTSKVQEKNIISSYIFEGYEGSQVITFFDDNSYTVFTNFMNKYGTSNGNWSRIDDKLFLNSSISKNDENILIESSFNKRKDKDSIYFSFERMDKLPIEDEVLVIQHNNSDYIPDYISESNKCFSFSRKNVKFFEINTSIGKSDTVIRIEGSIVNDYYVKVKPYRYHYLENEIFKFEENFIIEESSGSIFYKNN